MSSRFCFGSLLQLRNGLKKDLTLYKQEIKDGRQTLCLECNPDLVKGHFVPILQDICVSRPIYFVH